MPWLNLQLDIIHDFAEARWLGRRSPATPEAFISAYEDYERARRAAISLARRDPSSGRWIRAAAKATLRKYDSDPVRRQGRLARKLAGALRDRIAKFVPKVCERCSGPIERRQGAPSPLCGACRGCKTTAIISKEDQLARQRESMRRLRERKKKAA